MSNKVEEQGNSVPEHIFHYVENELYLYKTYKSTINELELDLEDLFKRSRQISSDLIPNHKESRDPVNITALQTIILEERIKHLLSRIHKIEVGLNLLNSDEKSIVESKYLSGLEYTNDDIMMKLRFSRNRYYKLRQGIIRKYAVFMGLI